MRQKSLKIYDSEKSGGKKDTCDDHADLFQNECRQEERSDGAVMRLSSLIFCWIRIADVQS